MLNLEVLAPSTWLESAGHFVVEGLNLIQHSLLAAERRFYAFLFFFNRIL